MYSKTPESGYCISEMKECIPCLMAENSDNRLACDPSHQQFSITQVMWDRVIAWMTSIADYLAYFGKWCVLISVPEAKWLTKTNVAWLFS
jgi:hypothetical protein